MKKRLTVLTKHNEELPVVWIDFQQKKMMVQKQLEKTHSTYLYDFDEVKPIKGKRIIEKLWK